MNTCLHTLFENQAALYPKAIALKSEVMEISYQTLNEQSNQLANFLLKKSVKNGDNVKICLDRSIEMIIGILGILKSGAAYVPVNPDTPIDRYNFLKNDINNPILVTNKKFFQKISKNIYQPKIICLDTNWDEISACSTESPKTEIIDSHIAVILYTSGSTGYPKGVLLSHKSLVNRLIWDRDTYQHTPADIVLQHAAYTFDFSILEIFMALANGGKLILARPEFHYESHYLIDLIQQEKITKIGSVPSLLKAYVNLPDFENCTSLKQVFLGGETLHYNLRDTFFKKSSAELINIYGPTETSISVLNWTCKRNCKEKTVPIGFPAANMRVYLLDDKKEPVADGSVGEIYIAGIGVANGYHNRSDLTNTHFLPDPFVKEKEARMYKTGDLGKKLSNGSFQFLGRKDNQIKIRGMRIELEEIEYHIVMHDSIGECIVAGVENKNKEMKLAAYVITASGKNLNIDEIREYLLSKLPDYMAPSLFVHVDRFPLSPNGKIDRKALSYPDNIRLLSQLSYTPPVNDTQRNLIRIWEKVLQLKPIGITDSFDNLGGDSLAAVEIQLLIESEMQCKLSLSSFVHANTIQKLAKTIDANSKPSNPINLITLRSEGDKTPIIFVGAVQGVKITTATTLMKYLDLAHPLLATVPFGLDASKIPDSIEACARHYVQLLERYYSSSDYIIGGHSMGGLVAYEMAIILQEKGKSVNFLFLLDTYHPTILKSNMNNYQITKRVSSFFKQMVKSNNQIKKELIKRLAIWGINTLKSLSPNQDLYPIFKRLQMIFGIRTKKDKIPIININHLYALQYLPKSYNNNVLLLSANGGNRKYLFSMRDENAREWAKEISGKLIIKEIPGTHISILQHPNIEIVANIINDFIRNE